MIKKYSNLPSMALSGEQISGQCHHFENHLLFETSCMYIFRVSIYGKIYSKSKAIFDLWLYLAYRQEKPLFRKISIPRNKKGITENGIL